MVSRHLGQNVWPDLPGGKPAAGRKSDGDRRIDMTSRHMTDRIRHGEKCKAERKGHANKTDADMRKGRRYDSAAAAAES